MSSQKKIVAVVALNTISALSQHNGSIYNWNALVNARTYLPLPHASLLNLNGKIHFLSRNSTTYVRISNLNYKLYNGVLDHVREKESRNLPLPEDAKELENAFQIIYNDHGLVEKILTERDEKEFSRNVKRAIASIFQVNSSIADGDYYHSKSFIVRENSLYGNVAVEYTVYPRGSQEIELHKLYDNSENRFNFDYRHKTGSRHCEVKPEQSVMQNSKQIYTITTNEGNRIIKHIRNVGTIVYYPYQARSDAQSIVIHQTFVLAEVAPKEEFDIKSPVSEQTLTYHQYDVLDDGIIDATNGRHTLQYQQILPQIREILEDIPVYLKENHIVAQDPDTKRGQAINRVQRLLSKLNTEKLLELERSIELDSLEIYYSILPLVGTTASALRIKNLIINKEIHDDIAVDILQKTPEYLYPSVELLGELEELIHLNDTFSWEVRKVAILSFGTLVHRSYLHAKKRLPFTPKDDLQNQYQKYVDEYAFNMKNSKLYKIQMVYILGLRNMRLPTTLKDLIPAFNGELWSNQHLRFLSMWAASAALLDTDSDTLFETLWPIFSNRDELREMRIVSFYYLTISKSIHSTVENLITYLITETDDEVHNFCYTYLQSVLRSKNPCQKELRLKVAQILKFVPLPKGGTSSATYYGYTDSNHNFGLELQDYVINTNQSSIHGVFFLSHDYTNYQEETMLYIKFQDGLPGDATSVLSLYEKYTKHVLLYRLSPHFEGALVKYDKVVNIFYFSESESPEDFRRKHWLFKNSEVKKTLLDINYQRYQRVLIPTDIGFPALWEFLHPQINQDDFKLAFTSRSMEAEYRHVSWIYSKHGLRFYNPICDIWQGANRYHSYDESLPVSVKFWEDSIDNVGLSWKKNDDPVRSIGGVRNHVKQMVYVQDEYRRNILKQSCPLCKEFHIADDTNSKQNYTLVDVDDFNTGHKLHMGLFSSDVHISNGSFKHQMMQFVQGSTKQTQSPLDHLVLSLINWRQYTLLSPDSGTYGFIAQVVPSQTYDVSNIKIYLRLAPRASSFQLTYAVENGNQILKAWVVNASVAANMAETVEKATVNLTRLVPGQKNYRVCLTGAKKVSGEEASGHLTVGMGQVDDDVCPDESTIQVTLTGNRSPEQVDGKHKYAACQYFVPYMINSFNTSECLASMDSLRHYKYSIKTKNLPNQLRKSTIRWWDRLVGYYNSYYTFKEQNNDKLDSKDLQVQVEFPMQTNDIDIKVSTSENVHDLSGIPTDYWRWFGVSPDNIKSPQLFLSFVQEKKPKKCTVYFNRRQFEDKLIKEVVPNNWTVYLQDESSTGSIYLKAASNNTLEMKAVYPNVTLEVTPFDKNFQIAINGEQRSIWENFKTEWIKYHSFVNVGEASDFFFGNGFILEYDVNHVKFYGYSFGRYQGLCSHEKDKNDS